MVLDLCLKQEPALGFIPMRYSCNPGIGSNNLLWKVIARLQVISGNLHWSDEKNKHELGGAEAQIYNNFIDNAGLLDLPLEGRSFTWMNKEGTQMSKLDRFLVSSSVMDAFPDLRVTVLPRGWSDYIPLMHHDEKIDYGPIPFKFFRSWLKRDGFEECIKTAYDECSEGNGRIKFHEKLKVIKQKIKAWHNTVKYADISRKQEVMLRIIEIDKNIDKCIASDVEKQERLDLLKECNDLTNLEDMDMVQKARIKWDVKGDENSKNFHGMLKQKRNQQMVKVIMIDGEWVTDPHRLFKPDVEAAVRDFFDHFVMSKGENSSFITLILKVANPIHIKDFRPISLIGMYYNIITKILANRLAKVVDKVVSPEQSAFISGKQILDGPLMLSELMAWYKKQNHKLIMFKVGFEKVYDTLSWKFLDHMLSALGFCSKWMRWIQLCLQTSRSSALVNGSPSAEFLISRGLRQGDPLSPFLFLIIMEGLNTVLKDVVGSGLIHGTKVGDTNLNISHSFYADDVVIVSEWNKQDMENIIRVMQVFYLASGLKINISKSNVYEIGVSSEEIKDMARETGCASGSLPFVYLGLPIGSNMNLIVNWQFMIDRFRRKLSTWKANMLSIGGRFTLIKAVLRSLGIYYLSLFKCPESVIKKLESLRASFFGAIGIGSLKAFNLALLQKWRWRLVTISDSLWARVVKAIHGDDTGMELKG
ncbi:putative RNA-directed DNA polymerase, eukaryota, reverse transcriptase zinc-binding domain protein [Tanacetum coccineum]